MIKGSYIINKAQAYLHLGDLDQGITFALKGMQLASEYRSRRHILWLDKTYKQLKERAIGSDKRLLTLRDALDEKQHEIESW